MLGLLASHILISAGICFSTLQTWALVDGISFVLVTYSLFHHKCEHDWLMRELCISENENHEKIRLFRRHRRQQNVAEYSVVAGSVTTNGSAVTAVLESTVNKLKLSIVSLDDSTIRLLIDEEGTPIRPRYQPLDALKDAQHLKTVELVFFLSSWKVFSVYTFIQADELKFRLFFMWIIFGYSFAECFFTLAAVVCTVSSWGKGVWSM